MTKGCTDTLLSCQIFLIAGPSFQISYFFLPQFWERYGVTLTAVSVTGAVLLSLWTNSVSGLLKSAVYQTLYGTSRMPYQPDLTDLQSPPTHFYECGY